MTALEFVWAFLNSPLGMAFVLGAMGHVLILIFKAKPEWQKIYEQNKGLFADAVKFADENLPAGTPGTGAAKAKLALDYVNKLEHPVADVKDEHLVHCIEAAHAATT